VNLNQAITPECGTNEFPLLDAIEKWSSQDNRRASPHELGVDRSSLGIKLKEKHNPAKAEPSLLAYRFSSLTIGQLIENLTFRIDREPPRLPHRRASISEKLHFGTWVNVVKLKMVD
jgi:hypothetical protein